MYRIFDGLFVTSLVLGGMVLAENAVQDGFLSDWFATTKNWHLGAEYDCIAQAIFAGRGFSDPFKTESGPTAWMPPVLPVVLASLYWLTDFQPQIVIDVVLGVKAMVIILTGMIVLAEARRLGVAVLGYGCLPIAFAANFYEFFQITHDLWLLLLMVDLLWLGLIYFWRPRSKLRAIIWGLFGGTAALSSPVVGAMWAICTLMSVAWQDDDRMPSADATTQSTRTQPFVKSTAWLGLVIAACVSMLVVTPWTIRNYLVFDRWIPIKSNSAYELWQSQCLDDDGVLDRQLTTEHPYSTDGEQRALYIELGETAFLERKARAAWSCLKADPWGYVQRLGHRSLAGLIWYYPYSDSTRQRQWSFVLKRCVFPLATLSAIVLLACGSRQQPQWKWALLIWLLGLAPYILVSYGDRYAAPLLPMKLIMILHAGATLLPRSWWAGSTTATSNRMAGELKFRDQTGY